MQIATFTQNEEEKVKNARGKTSLEISIINHKSLTPKAKILLKNKKFRTRNVGVIYPSEKGYEIELFVVKAIENLGMGHRERIRTEKLTIMEGWDKGAPKNAQNYIYRRAHFLGIIPLSLK